jgi:antitoxin CptB
MTAPGRLEGGRAERWASSAEPGLSEPNFAAMTEDLDSRRRRAGYRSHHRGTKEMDWILGRFADRVLADMAEHELARFEQLLAMPDPDLHKMFLDPGSAPADAAVAELLARMRAFHGLDR